jgi:hypothetical protein
MTLRKPLNPVRVAMGRGTSPALALGGATVMQAVPHVPGLVTCRAGKRWKLPGCYGVC